MIERQNDLRQNLIKFKEWAENDIVRHYKQGNPLPLLKGLNEMILDFEHIIEDMENRMFSDTELDQVQQLLIFVVQATGGAITIN